MNLNIQQDYKKVFPSHDFNYSKPIKVSAKYTDYICENCGSMLYQIPGGYYTIVNPNGYGSKIFSILSCSEILMESILT